MSAAFADVDTAAWPVVVVRFRNVKPSADEASAYFAALASILNGRATPAAPCAIVFDASGIPMQKLAQGVSTDFFSAHNDFNKAYYEHYRAVCAGFGVVVAQKILLPLVRTAIKFAPPTHPCADYKNAADAITALRALLASR